MDPREIQGMRNRFGPVLLLPFTCTPDLADYAPVRLHSLEGWIVSGTEQSALGGIRIPSQVVGPNNARLVVPITDEQIEAIEQRRTDEAVILHIKLAGVASMPKPTERWPLHNGTPNQVTASPIEVHQIRDSGGDLGQQVRIEREQWLSMLQGFGAGKRRLVELPEPNLPVGQAEWSECLRLLTEATLHYRRHDFEPVLDNCRKIVEGVTAILCSRWGIPREVKRPFSIWSKDLPAKLATIWTVEPDDSTMFFGLLNAAWTWTRHAPHYGSGVPFRDDVTFALSLATDLIVFSSKVFVVQPYATQPTP